MVKGNLLDEIKEFIGDNCLNYIDLLSEIVSKNTINSFGNERLAMDVIKSFLDNLNINYNEYFLDKNRPNLVIRIGSDVKECKKIILMAHIDTVEVGIGWLTNPFKLVKKEGKLFGLGVADDKGPLVSLLMIIHFLNKKDLSYAIDLVLTVDEENGGKFGVDHLLKENILSAEFAIIADNSGELERISIVEKGSLKLRVFCHGDQVHSAYSHGCDNSIVKMAKFISKLDNFILDHEPNSFLTPPIINPVKISAGISSITIPPLCECELNIRIVPGQKKGHILNELKKLSMEFGDFNFEVLGFFEPAMVNTNLEVIKIIQEEAKKSGYNVKLSGMNAGTDAKKLIHHGIPAIGYSFTNEGVAHSSNEYIVEDFLFKYVEIMINSLLKLDLK